MLLAADLAILLPCFSRRTLPYFSLRRAIRARCLAPRSLARARATALFLRSLRTFALWIRSRLREALALRSLALAARSLAVRSFLVRSKALALRSLALAARSALALRSLYALSRTLALRSLAARSRPLAARSA